MMDDTKKAIWLFGGLGTIIILIFLGLIMINKASNNQMEKVGAVPLAKTYYQDMEEKATKNKENAQKKLTVSELAQQAVLNQIGVYNKSSNAYPIDSIDNSDGLFVKQGVLNGNGIPYSSNFNNDSGGVTGNNSRLSTVKGYEYAQNQKNEDYATLMEQAEQEIANQNNNSTRVTDIKNILKKAKKDTQQANNNLNAKDLPAQFVKTKIPNNITKNEKNNSNRNSSSSNKAYTNNSNNTTDSSSSSNSTKNSK